MSMRDQIIAALQPLHSEHLDVQDESHMHSRGQETHYKAVIVSPAFVGLNAVKRHQKVYATLGQRIHNDEVHALSMKTFTPAEWAARG